MLFLSRYRLAILIPLLAARVPTVLTDVTWDSPSAGDVYVPGDTLQAVWTSQDMVVAPSFTICTGSADSITSTSTDDNPDCGTAVWPQVMQNGTEYSISLAIPNITGNGAYHLVMKDDRGTAYDTPKFSLALADDAVSNANTTAISSSQPASTSVTYVTSRSAPAVAAIAVPLSLVAAVLFGAFILLLYHARRSRQRKKDQQKQLQDTGELETRSRQSTVSFASATDIERAVWALSANRGYGGTAPFAHAPPPVSASAGSGLNPAAAAATALGMGAFGWAHGFGHAALPPQPPPMMDAYTPAPVRMFTSDPAASTNQRYASQAPQPARGYSEQQTTPRPINWSDIDWRDTDRVFAEEPASTQPFGPPLQLPAIQVHVSSSPGLPDLPPPPPPKQLFPGKLDIHAPRAYTPSYGSSSSPPLLASELNLRQTPGLETHTSLNVVSSYMQPSPALAQCQHLAPPDTNIQELLAPRIPSPSLIRARTLRRLETLHEREEDDKPLPLRPQERIGTDLYDAVSKAVRN